MGGCLLRGGGLGRGVPGALPGVEIPWEWRYSVVHAGFQWGDGGSWLGVCLLPGKVRPIAVHVGLGRGAS